MHRVRRLVAVLALTLAATSSIGAAHSTSRPLVLALEGGTLGVPSTLVAVDAATLDVVRRGARLPSWAFGYVYARSSDGRSIAVTPRPSATADHLYFADTRTLRVRGFVALGETPCTLAWPTPSVVLALVSIDCGSGTLRLLAVDPVSLRIVSRSVVGQGAVEASARIPGGLIAVVAASGRSRVVIATTGGVRTAALPGHARRNEFVSLTVDARRGHAYVAAGGLNVADVRLATAGVRTHNLAGSRTTAMLKKGATGPPPSLAVVSPGELAVALGEPGPNETVRPRGAWLVDTSSWRRRLLTADASKVAAGDGQVIAFDGRPGSGAFLFSATGRLCARLAGGSTVDGAFVVGRTLLLDLQGTPAGFALPYGRRTFYGGDDALMFGLLGPSG